MAQQKTKPIYQKKNPNSNWFQLLKCEICCLYHCIFNIFELRTVWLEQEY